MHYLNLNSGTLRYSKMNVYLTLGPGYLNPRANLAFLWPVYLTLGPIYPNLEPIYPTMGPIYFTLIPIYPNPGANLP